MLFVAALEAERIPAKAIDHCIYIRRRTYPFYCVLALLRVGAPADHPVVVGERFAVPAEVLLQDQIIINAVPFLK